jgi:hypothetical protein
VSDRSASLREGHAEGLDVAGSTGLSSARRFLVTAFAVCAALFVIHPAQHTFWFDIEQRLTEASRLPFSVSGAAQAIALQARVHSPNYVRPVRAIQWLALARTLGVDPWRIYVTNILSLGLAITCLMELARGLGANPYIAGLCFAVSYVSVLPIIFVGFGFTLGFGLLGLLAYFRGAVWLGFALLLIATLSHETMLALSLVPLAHAVIERTPRRPAYLAAGVIPIYVGCRTIHAMVFGSAPVWTALSENVARVVFAFASGGLPLEPVRALPWLPPYLRVRELFLTWIGVVSLIAVCLPAVVLTILACRRASPRRVVFCGVWAAFGFLPLLLPVTTPEAYHLSVALAAVFILWSSQPLSRSLVIALAAWLLVHGWAREHLFYHDLPIMAKAVETLRPLRDDARAMMVNAPIQVGPHYAMLPDLGFRGCFVDPVWIWSRAAHEGLEAEKRAARRILESGTSFVRLCE